MVKAIRRVPLSDAARRARAPLPPAVLAGALNDIVPLPYGNSRVRIRVKVQKCNG